MEEMRAVQFTLQSYNLIDFDKHDLIKISMNFYNGAVGSRLKHVFDVKNSICDLLISDILSTSKGSAPKISHPSLFEAQVWNLGNRSHLGRPLSSRKKTSKSHVLVGGNSNIFGSFTPNLGEDEPTLTFAYVSNGLVKNHQLVSSWDPQKHHVEWVLRTQTKRTYGVFHWMALENSEKFPS